MYPRITFSIQVAGDTQASWRSHPVGSNMSNASVALNGSIANNGYAGFILSPSTSVIAQKLDGKGALWKSLGSYPGYISNTVTPTLSVDETFIFDIAGATPKVMFLDFDTVAGEYATSYTVSNSVNSKTIQVTGNTDFRTRVDLTPLTLPEQLPNDATISVHITGWSRVGGSVRITSARFGALSQWVLTGRDLIDFECSENLYDAQLNMRPGICEQYADIRFYDRHGVFKSINQTADCSVIIETVNPQDVLGTYRVSNWDIPGESSEITAHCTDRSFILDEIKLSAGPIATRTVHSLLTAFFRDGGGLPWRYATAEDRAYCESISTENCWYNAGTLRELLDKVCWLGMLRIYWRINAFVVTKAWTEGVF